MLISFIGFGQANSVSAKTIIASQSVSIRGSRIDSLSADGNFTNGSGNVIPTQAAVKSFVNPIKARVDSMYKGQIVDTTHVLYVGLIHNIYTSSDGKFIFDKGWGVGDAYVRTNSDSSNKIVLKATGITPGAYTNINGTVDSTGRFTAISNGTAGGGVSKKTINSQNANYILIQGDSSKYITVNASIQDTISIPDDGTAAMTPPINIEVYQIGSGKVLFQPLNGSVTVNGRLGKNKTGGQYSKVILNKISANTWVITGDLDTATVGFLTTSLSSLPALTANAGAPSSADSLTTSGFNLTAGGLVTAPTGFEVSLDNSNYATTKTISLSGTSLAGQPVKVYVRIAATTPAGTPSGFVVFSSTGVSPQSVSISGTVNATFVSAIFNFSSTASTQAGATNFFGDPTLSPQFTDATTGWTLKAIGANWVKFGGSNFGGVGNGATVASSDGIFTQVQIRSNLYNISDFSAGQYQLQFTNLPAGAYDIYLLGSIPTSVFDNGTGGSGGSAGNMQFRVQFGTGSDNVSSFDPNNKPSATGNITTSGPGVTNVQTGSFTGTITAGQVINIAVIKAGIGALGYINAIKILKH